ncbi:MAG: hypothetical protein HUU54_04110 [Ignavibacteriaceae bacterium]|nr:hypothetical protein [Ignavibacteriaceae bacterium]
MKKCFFLFLLASVVTFGQYYNERTTAENFEYSNIHFKSYYLNPYGLAGFKEIAAGFISDPFLKLKINPANLPEMEESDLLFYLDFRGDWTEADYYDGYAVPTFSERIAYPYYTPDRRWNSLSRTEPEPIVSLGFISRPISEITDKFYLGGSYEYLRKNESYNEFPYGIYYYNYYYDALGYRTGSEYSSPSVYRYLGADELTNNGHFFSLFAGLEISDDIKIGVGMNGVVHTRDGKYANTYRDEYSSTGEGDWSSAQSVGREQKYDHLDFTAGVKYKLTKTLSLGFKAGMLNGTADQSYEAYNYYYSQNNKPDTSSTWYYYFSDGSTSQTWTLDGKTTYIGFDFQKSFRGGKELHGYYKYSYSGLDLNTFSSINDTNRSSSRSQYISDWYMYKGHSAARDNRTGRGERNIKSHEGVLNFRWNLTGRSSLSAGVYYNMVSTTVDTREPVKAYRVSDYTNSSSGGSNSNYFLKLIEDKTLVWNYTSEYTTLQIPVIFCTQLGERWEMLIGVARISNAWNIEESTSAYFTKRERTDADTSKIETDFSEKYLYPDKKLTEDLARFMMQFKMNITGDLSARVMFEPSFDPYIRVAQWWLAFEARL